MYTKEQNVEIEIEPTFYIKPGLKQEIYVKRCTIYLLPVIYLKYH